MELKFPVGLEKNEVLIERDGIKIEVPWPVQIQILKERNKKAKYDVIRNEKNIYIAEADVEVNKENRFHITDMWEQNTNNIKLSRKVACISAEKETAIREYNEIYNQVQLMQDEAEKEVLERRYLLGDSWWRIAVKMNYAESHIYRIHGVALSHFQMTEHESL